MMKMVVIMVSISLAMSGSQPLAVAGDSPLLIGLFDSSQLSGQSNVLMKPLAKALRDRGYKTIALIPQRAKDPQQITRSRLDVLIYLGADHTIAMGQRCIEYLKEGGRFWFIGDAGPFTGSVFTAVDSSDQFIFQTESATQADLLRAAHAENPNVGKIPESKFLTRQIHRGSMFTWRSIASEKIINPPVVLPAGNNYFPKSINAYCQAASGEDVMVLSLRSGDMPWIRPGCQIIGLAKTKYEFPSWTSRKSSSSGFPLGVIADNCVEFGGSRTLFTGQAVLEKLSRVESDWPNFVNEAIRMLTEQDLVVTIAPHRPILNQNEPVEIEIRLDNYQARRQQVQAVFTATRRGGGKVQLDSYQVKVKPREQIKHRIHLDADRLQAGIYDLELTINDKVLHRHMLSILPGPAVPLSRQTFWICRKKTHSAVFSNN